jgi:hypothetical protein
VSEQPHPTLRELPMLRKVRLEQGAGVLAESAGNKGWDPRTSKSGLFASFGANGGALHVESS